MAKAKILILSVNDGTPQEAFQILVQEGMQVTEILALLDLASHKAKTSGVDGFIDDNVAQAATGQQPRPKIAIGTKDEGTPDEDIVVKVRRGTNQIGVVGFIEKAKYNVQAAGVHGFLSSGIEIARSDFLKNFPSPIQA